MKLIITFFSNFKIFLTIYGYKILGSFYIFIFFNYIYLLVSIYSLLVEYLFILFYKNINDFKIKNHLYFYLLSLSNNWIFIQIFYLLVWSPILDLRMGPFDYKEIDWPKFVIEEKYGNVSSIKFDLYQYPLKWLHYFKLENYNVNKFLIKFQFFNKIPILNFINSILKHLYFKSQSPKYSLIFSKIYNKKNLFYGKTFIFYHKINTYFILLNKSFQNIFFILLNWANYYFKDQDYTLKEYFIFSWLDNFIVKFFTTYYYLLLQIDYILDYLNIQITNWLELFNANSFQKFYIIFWDELVLVFSSLKFLFFIFFKWLNAYKKLINKFFFWSIEYIFPILFWKFKTNQYYLLIIKFFKKFRFF